MAKQNSDKNFEINDNMVNDKQSEENSNDDKKKNDGNKNGSTFEINDSSAK